ncbi:MAG TPA: peptidoglycan DD-metalloendopeptidase family protein [Alphaproteobacteria bacterium]|nr:peptidoglycan DD-metalloendopeptidase family protein [Alphaproteobacteria bacterium]
MVTETVYLAQQNAQQEEQDRLLRERQAKEAEAKAAARTVTTPTQPSTTPDSPQNQPLAFDNLNPMQQGLAMLFFFLAMLLDPEKMSGTGLDKLFGSILGLDPNKGENFGKWQSDALRSGKSSSEIARGHNYRNFNFAEASVLAASDTPILELIGKHESGGDYNNVYGRKKYGVNQDFTSMTVDQVLAWQQNYTRNVGSASSAVGKYQVIQETLKNCKKEMGLSGNEKFDQAMQDRIALHLLDKRGYQSFLKGNISAEKFANNISKEWASLPKDASGLSYYHGDGLNKSGVSWGTLLASVQGSRNSVRSPAADTALAAANGGSVVLDLPLDSKKTSSFGPRNIAVEGASKNHGGIDMRAAVGTPLVAQGPAQVAYAGPSGGYGQAVILNHGQGVFTLYGHVEPNMPARTGQMLKIGDKFAVTGDEGVGAAHLHYEILLQGRDGRAYRVDPEQAVGKNLSDPAVRQTLIAQASDKMGVDPSRLASRAFDARVDDDHKHAPVQLAQATQAPRPQPETPKAAVAEKAPESPAAPRPTASVASAELGDWLAKKLPGIAPIFTGRADPTATTAKADDKPAAAPAAAKPDDKPAAAPVAVAKLDDDQKPKVAAAPAPAPA